MNNEKLGAAPQMYAGGDTKQAIKFAWTSANFASADGIVKKRSQ